jgi:hypothetical protein
MNVFKNLTAALLVSAVAAPAVMASGAAVEADAAAMRSPTHRADDGVSSLSLTAPRAGGGAAGAGAAAAAAISFFDDSTKELNLGGRFYEKAAAEESSSAEAAKLVQLYSLIQKETGRDDVSFADAIKKEFSVKLDNSDAYDALLGDYFDSISGEILSRLKADTTIWTTLKAPYTLDSRLQAFKNPSARFRDRILVRKHGSSDYSPLSFDALSDGTQTLDASDDLVVRSKNATKPHKPILDVVSAAQIRAGAAGIKREEALLDPQYSKARLPLYIDKYNAQKASTAVSVAAVQSQLDTEKMKVAELTRRLASTSSEDDFFARLRANVGVRSGVAFDTSTIKEWRSKSIQLAGVSAELRQVKEELATLKASITGAHPAPGGKAGAGGATFETPLNSLILGSGNGSQGDGTSTASGSSVAHDPFAM